MQKDIANIESMSMRMNENMYQFWKVTRWFLLAMYGIIVSAGAINASFAFAKLHELEPAVYEKDSIFVIFGIVNLILTAWVVYRGVKKDNV